MSFVSWGPQPTFGDVLQSRLTLSAGASRFVAIFTGLRNNLRSGVALGGLRQRFRKKGYRWLRLQGEQFRQGLQAGETLDVGVTRVGRWLR